MGVSESQRMVGTWSIKLRELGWPEDEIRSLVSDLMEAGYRKCIEDGVAIKRANEALVQRAVRN